MCRFITYKGKTPIVLKTLLKEAQNSLIAQSRLAKESKTGLNADGFGVGWYDQTIDDKPAVFKSIQPAWSDENLINLSSKIRSDCFIGHVRACTVGDVNISNCHPFSYKNFLFAHNGTIQNFNKIRKDLILLLDEDYFAHIKGQTDSEHLFYLLCNIMEKKTRLVNLDAEMMARGYTEGVYAIRGLFEKYGMEPHIKINAVLTTGKELTAIRYTTEKELPFLTLYYSIKKVNGKAESVIISSERLNAVLEEWEEIPMNHILAVDSELNINIRDIS